MINHEIGTVVTLKVPCLGNPIGTEGIAYYDYGTGTQFIFENGEYDGFSIEEQDQFLNYSHTIINFSYKFINVIRLSQDFKKGLFEPFFRKTK